MRDQSEVTLPMKVSGKRKERRLYQNISIKKRKLSKMFQGYNEKKKKK